MEARRISDASFTLTGSLPPALLEAAKALEPTVSGAKLEWLFTEVHFGIVRFPPSSRAPRIVAALAGLEEQRVILRMRNSNPHTPHVIVAMPRAVPLDVLEFRLRDELDLPVWLEELPFQHARIVRGQDRALATMVKPLQGSMFVRTPHGALLGIFASPEAVSACEQENPRLVFSPFKSPWSDVAVVATPDECPDLLTFNRETVSRIASLIRDRLERLKWRLAGGRSL
jgi:hypothetical protein